MVEFKAKRAVFPSHESHLLIQLPGPLNSCVSAAGEGVGVWGAPASHPLAAILQYQLAKDAVKALYEVHGIEYIYGSISATLCEWPWLEAPRSPGVGQVRAGS